MAKTIKEIVLELKNHPIRHNNGALWETGYREGCQFGAIHGANYVLSEIERIINENEDGCLALERIQLRLSELKGE